jgi:hypothetical protein
MASSARAIRLSTLKYERKEGIGRLVFARVNHPHIQMDLALKLPVALRSFGAVRKLLQMASGDYSLLSDSYDVYGLGRVLPTYELAAEDVFTVHFSRQFAWSLFHGDQSLMHVRFGQASIRLPGFPERKFRTDVTRVFPGIQIDAVDRLTAIARCLGGQEHGGMLLISTTAEQEAERLNAQSTRVHPFLLTEALIPMVTAIDGSVLVDTQGTCHAIGVILDGMASAACSPDRGSRYNSAVRYIASRSDSMAIVKSEDGMINIFPDLRPQIRRSEIRNALRSLRSVATTLPVDAEALGDLIAWLHKHEFYLTADECQEAERLHAEAEQKLPEGEMRLGYSRPLAPHSDMNESYYLPERV